jgi:hypothetical protein
MISGRGRLLAATMLSLLAPAADTRLGAVAASLSAEADVALPPVHSRSSSSSSGSSRAAGQQGSRAAGQQGSRAAGIRPQQQHVMKSGRVTCTGFAGVISVWPGQAMADAATSGLACRQQCLIVCDTLR